MSSMERAWQEELRALGRQRSAEAQPVEDPTLARLLQSAANTDGPASRLAGDPLTAATLAAGAVASGLAGRVPNPASDAIDAPLRAVIEEAFDDLPDGPPQSLERLLLERGPSAPLNPSLDPTDRPR